MRRAATQTFPRRFMFPKLVLPSAPAVFTFCMYMNTAPSAQVGTAGTPTGMNSSLKAFQEAQAQTAALLQEQERKRQLQLEEQRKQEAAEQQ